MLNKVPGISKIVEADPVRGHVLTNAVDTDALNWPGGVASMRRASFAQAHARHAPVPAQQIRRQAARCAAGQIGK